MTVPKGNPIDQVGNQAGNQANNTAIKATLIKATLNASPYAHQRHGIALLLLLTMLLGLMTFSLMMGSQRLGFADSVQTLFANAPSQFLHLLIWEMRLPRALVAVLVGALFALSGAVLQHVTRNPLADPSLVGVSQGASLAMVIAIVLFPGIDNSWHPLLALAGALFAATLIQAIALHRGDSETLRFILVGVGVAAMISAVIAALLTYGQLDRAQSALAWLSGSVYAATWAQVRWLLSVVAVVLPLLFIVSPVLAVLRMGEEIATGLGVATRRSQTLFIALAVVMAAFAVCVAGPLGFVGLIAPHIARRLFSGSMRLHLCYSAVIGALLVALADLLGRTVVAPIQIPAGLVTVIIGVPCFVFLLLKHYQREEI